jgi:hypothetical protein
MIFGRDRANGGSQGARSRAIVEPLRSSAVELQQGAHCQMGSCRQAGSFACLWLIRLSYALVVGRSPGGRRS